MSSITTSLENYEVLDEDLSPEDDKPAKKRNGRNGLVVGEDGGNPQPTFSTDNAGDPEEAAKLMQEMAKLAFDHALTGAETRCKAIEAKSAKNASELVEYMKKQSELYARPQNLVMHVRMGDLPTVRLSHRAAKVLPKLLAQCKIGQSGGNWPLMFGPTGCGKTVAAEQVAETLGLPFEHVNCSEGMSETWLWGRQTPAGFIAGGLWKCFKDGGVFLFDEADAANDNVWLSINTMLANGHAHNPICGESAKRHPNFIAIAAANTNGKGGTGAYSGRTRLDGATLNRFAMFEVSYDPELERELCKDTKLLEVLWGIRVKFTEKASADVISTRDIKNASFQMQAGFTASEIIGCLRLRMDKANYPVMDEAIREAATMIVTPSAAQQAAFNGRGKQAKKNTEVVDVIPF